MPHFLANDRIEANNLIPPEKVSSFLLLFLNLYYFQSLHFLQLNLGRTPYEIFKYWYNLKLDMFRSMVFGGMEQCGET
jgi:hypothetical protein